MDFFNFVMDHLSVVVAVALQVVGAASIVANVTPTQTDNKVVDFVGKIVNFLAGYWNDPDKSHVVAPVAAPKA